MSLLYEVCKWNLVEIREKIIFGNITIHSSLISRIKETQERDGTLQCRRDKAVKGELSGYIVGSYGILRYQNRIFLPQDEGIKKKILNEAHRSRHTVHLGGNKMYQDLKQHYC